MKILYIHGSAELYGSDRSLLRLASRMVRDGHKVAVALPEQGPLVGKLQSAGVSVVSDVPLAIINRSTFSNGNGLLRFIFIELPAAIRAASRYLHLFGPDLVHTNSAVVLSFGPACRWRRIPHVWHVREHFHSTPAMWHLYQLYMRLFSSGIVCVSTSVADQFPSRIREKKVFVVHNGIPKSEFPDISGVDIEAFRQKYGLGPRRLVVLVGRIKMHRKGQETLIAAAAELQDKYPDVAFVIVGSPYRGNEAQLEALRELVRNKNLVSSVVFTGDIHPAHVAFAAAEIAVMASGEPEPFGGVVIEAMALGRPVVGTAIGGTVEQIENGVTGFLVSPNDSHEMAKALDLLLSNSELCQRQGRAARERFLKKFEFEAFMENMTQVYRRVLHLSR